MNIYLLTPKPKLGYYPDCDKIVVAASDKEAARRTVSTPKDQRLRYNERTGVCEQSWHEGPWEEGGGWVKNIADIQVTCLGKAAPGVKAGVICTEL